MNWLRKRGLRLLGGGVIHCHTELVARKIVDGKYTDVRRVVKDKVVTTAFVNFIVAQLQTESSIFGDFKFHEMGLGSTAEANSDTALETTTGISRVTGTQEEGSSALEYKSVGTITADTTENIREHGLFNVSSGATLMDRTVFGSIAVVSGNQVEFTFTISFSAGG